MPITEPFYLHAVDPGKTTGLALMEITPDHYTLLTHAAILDGDDTTEGVVGQLKQWMELRPGRHVLVYEDFHVRPNVIGLDTTALEVIGKMQQWIDSDRPYDYVVVRQPLQGKHLITDQALKNAGLWASNGPDARHIRDALRHAVAHLQKLQHKALCRAAWPRRSQAGASGSAT